MWRKNILSGLKQEIRGELLKLFLQRLFNSSANMEKGMTVVNHGTCFSWKGVWVRRRNLTKPLLMMPKSKAVTEEQGE